MCIRDRWYTLKMELGDDMHTHISKIEDLAYRLSTMDEKISDKMLMSKILITLPDEYKYFHSAWESTPENQQTKANLISRLIAEESRIHPEDEANDSHALTSHKVSKYKNKQGESANKNPKRPGKCIYATNLTIGLVSAIIIIRIITITKLILRIITVKIIKKFCIDVYKRQLPFCLITNT